MEELLRRDIGGRVAVAVVTERSDGDVHPEHVDLDTLRQRQVRLTGATWVMLDEVHGTDVVVVGADSNLMWPIAGIGDVLSADGSSEMLAVWVADCAPIALFGSNGSAWVVAHGGWRGLADGVIDVAVDALGAEASAVAGSTHWGTDALDVPAAVAAGLARHGIDLDVVGVCTGCDLRFRSHRRRVDLERHAMVAWFEEAS